jgi:AcrR family transcriptional regulator
MSTATPPRSAEPPVAAPPLAARRTADRIPARERLLDAADELFYEEGVHTVGIDRIIERAGVAKASLYSTFGSKDELIRAYLARRYTARQERMTRMLERFDTPRERLLGVFDLLGELFAEPGYRGCAFVNASAESAVGSSIEQVSDEYRRWYRELFERLATEAGVSDPATFARQMVVLYDGAAISARMDHNPGASGIARGIAQLVLDAAH